MGFQVASKDVERCRESRVEPCGAMSPGRNHIARDVRDQGRVLRKRQAASSAH